MRKSFVVIMMIAAFGTAIVTTSCKGQKTGTDPQMEQQTPGNENMENQQNEQGTQPQRPPQENQHGLSS